MPTMYLQILLTMFVLIFYKLVYNVFHHVWSNKTLYVCLKDTKPQIREFVGNLLVIREKKIDRQNFFWGN